MHDAELVSQRLLYILIQRAGTGMLPPPGFAVPPWKHLAAQWDAIPPPMTPYATLGPCTLTMGRDDQEPPHSRLEGRLLLEQIYGSPGWLLPY